MSDRAIMDIFPLTPLQQGILFHTLMAPDGGLYIDQLVVELETKDEFDPGAFAAAVGATVDTVDMLRTAFVWEDQPEPLQLVLDHVPFDVSRLDWQAFDEAAAKSALETLLAAERGRGFDLTKPPLLRMVTIRWPDGSWRLVVTYHHITMDAWSILNLFAEIQENYRRERLGQALPTQRRHSFKQYVLGLSDRQRPDAEAFWRNVLSGMQGPTVLPAKRGKPEQIGSACGEHVHVLSVQQTDLIRMAAKREAVTMATLVQGGWALLLARYANTSDVVFGVTLAGRPADMADAGAMIGLFINTLPARIVVDMSENVGSWLQKLHRQFAKLRSHEFTPLTRVREWAELPQGIALFDSVMAFENIPGAANNTPVPERQAIGARNGRYLFRTNYPINVMVVPAEQMMLRINYDTRLFDAAYIEQVMRHFALLLDGLAGKRERKLGDLPMIGREECAGLLAVSSGPVQRYPGGSCIHDLFDDQATKAPDRIALADGVREWSYGELQKRADALAMRLIEAEVGPERRVAICSERSAELVSGVLAILKAGGVYLPLDPAYPKARLAMMLEAAKPTVILCQPSLMSRLPDSPVPILPLQEGTPGELVHRRPERRLSPDNGAYVIFTSGSTGTPKGIELAHRGLCNMIPCWNELFDVCAADRVLQFASFSFDASVWEIFSALTAGATLVFGSRETLYSADSLLSTLREMRITHALLPPSLLGVLDPDELPELRCVAAIGERCTADIARRWKAGRRFFNAYGPAEATITNSVHEVPDRPTASADPPIGRPMANVRMYALDSRQHMVPAGVVGELYIGGINLARGYVGLPGATADKFMPDPFADIPGARMYRTGDLVRIDDDGEFEYLGRADSQVKIRGVRVELNEVEGALRRHPSVRDAIVIAREVQAGLPEQRLIAYLIVPDGEPPHAAELRGHLRNLLPAAMVPSTFVCIDRIPLTPNGKIDKRKLPDPDETRSEVIGAFTPPRNETERRLAAIWAKVLRVPQVGINDNFFDLGGDSVVSIRLVAAGQRAGLIFAPRQVFENQTVAELAAVLAPAAGTLAAPLVRPPGPFPATAIQSWFLARAGARLAHENQSIVLRLEPGLPEHKLRAALQQLVDRHDALRLKAERTKEGGWRLSIRPPGTSVSLVRTDEPFEFAAALLARVQQRLDPETGDVFEAVLFADERGGDQLLIAAHHLSIDAVSWSTLLEDLSAACRGETMPDILVPFAAWADEVDGLASRGVFDRQLDYWMRVVGSGAAAGADLAVAGAAESELVRFPAHETERLLAMLPVGTTLGDLLLVAVATAFGAGTLVDMESMGRNLPELSIDASRTVGWFTAIAPFRIPDSLPQDASAAILEMASRRIEWESRASSYGILAWKVERTARELSCAPRRQFLFNWLGRPDLLCPEDAPFRLTDDDPGPLRDPGRPCTHWLELNAWLMDRQLNLRWTRPAEGFQADRARAAAAGVHTALAEMIGPVDAIDSDLSSEQLARALARINLQSIGGIA